MRHRDVFLAALAFPRAGWPSYLDRACGGDAELRRLVEELLQAHEAAGSFLEIPVCGARGRGEPTRLSARTPSDSADPGSHADPSSPKANRETMPNSPRRFGPYELCDLIGRGGMGEVYRAFDPTLKRFIALKLLTAPRQTEPDARARFLLEAEAAARITSDHVVPIYHVGEEAGVLYIAMPLLAGSSLDHWLQQFGEPSLPEVLRIGQEICRGLAVAHRQKLVHRDIKPANIWLEDVTGSCHLGVSDQDHRAASPPAIARVKILDFGLARTLEAPRGLTQSGYVLGTPEYMAPEQGQGDPVDERCDLYSLGALLYRLCAGVPPLQATSTMALLTALALEEPRPLRQLRPQLPVAFADLVMRLLAKAPAQRPRTAEEVEMRLKAVEEALPTAGKAMVVPPSQVAVSVTEPSSNTVSPIKRASLPLLLARLGRRSWLAAVVLVVLAGAGYFAMQREGAGSPSLVEKSPETPVHVHPTVAGFDPDRRAAEYALSVGGAVWIDDQKKEYRGTLRSLPQGPFRITHINVGDSQRVSDAGLAALRGCKSLQILDIYKTPVSDGGLAHLQDCPALENVAMYNDDRVSNEGLRYLKACKRMKSVALAGTGVTDASLDVLASWPELIFLDVGNNLRMRDAGLAYLRHCPKLETLLCYNNGVTDAGLAHLRHCRNLRRIELANLAMTDTGLAHLEECKVLDRITLDHVPITDAGLVHFKAIASLRHVDVVGTKVTRAAVEELRKALPNCTIVYGKDHADKVTLPPLDPGKAP